VAKTMPTTTPPACDSRCAARCRLGSDLYSLRDYRSGWQSRAQLLDRVLQRSIVLRQLHQFLVGIADILPQNLDAVAAAHGPGNRSLPEIVIDCPRQIEHGPRGTACFGIEPLHIRMKHLAES